MQLPGKEQLQRERERERERERDRETERQTETETDRDCASQVSSVEQTLKTSKTCKQVISFNVSLSLENCTDLRLE